MPQLVTAVTLFLATYYWSYAITQTHGPFGLARWLRRYVMIKRGFVFGFTRDGQGLWAKDNGVDILVPEDDWFVTGFHCTVCASIWIGALLLLWNDYVPDGGFLLLASAAAGLTTAIVNFLGSFSGRGEGS